MTVRCQTCAPRLARNDIEAGRAWRIWYWQREAEEKSTYKPRVLYVLDLSFCSVGPEWLELSTCGLRGLARDGSLD
jgi:hypothetical protein